VFRKIHFQPCPLPASNHNFSVTVQFAPQFTLKTKKASFKELGSIRESSRGVAFAARDGTYPALLVAAFTQVMICLHQRSCLITTFDLVAV